MKFKLFGTEITVTFLFAAVITLMLATDRTGLLLPALFAVFMHETGHLFAMWVSQCAPKQIKLIPASVQVVSRMDRSRGGELFVAVCGPAVNLVLFVSLYINYLAFHNEMCLYYAVINLLFCFFNLIPAVGLDGGVILINLLSRRVELQTAERIVRLLTALIAIVFFAVAVILTVRRQLNLSFYILAIYFVILLVIKN